MTQLSRREFAALAAGAAVSPFPAGQAPALASVTAQGLIDRIKAQIGVAWKSDTVDGVKAGDPAAVDPRPRAELARAVRSPSHDMSVAGEREACGFGRLQSR